MRRIPERKRSAFTKKQPLEYSRVLRKSLLPGCILAVLAAALLLMIKIPFIYTVNDDLFMKNIISGAYLGRPDAHTVYMEYPLSLLLAFCYRLTDRIPWYGLCFFLFHIVSWGCILYRVCRPCADPKIKTCAGAVPRAAAAGIFGLLLYASCGFYHTASVQFTVTAAILGSAALVWFYTADFQGSVRELLADQAVTAAFVFLSFNVRRNVLLMLVPVAGMLWLRRWLAEKERFGRDTLLKYMGTAVLSGALVLAAFLSYRAAYGSAGWQYYITYNDNATVLYDYYEWPDYEENRELYEELAISEEAYEGARDAYLLSMDGGIDAEAMARLAERSEKLHQENGTFPERLLQALSQTVQRSLSETDRPLNLIVTGLYALTAAGAILLKRFPVLWSLGALFTGRMFSWLYVIYEGRYPVRITQSLLLAECAVLFAVLFAELLLPGAGRKADRRGAYALGAALAAFCLVLALFSYTRIRHVYRENVWRLSESGDLQELKDYCAAREDNFYFVDTKSITNDTEWIFDPRGSRFENYIVFGGWLSGSPAFEEKLRLAGIVNAEEALIRSGRAYIIVENEDRCPTDYLENYFASRYEGGGLVKTGAFGRDGEQFIVYRVTAGEDGPDGRNGPDGGM